MNKLLLYQFFIRGLIKLTWLSVILIVGLSVYLIILIWRKRNNFKRLRTEFSQYRIPKVTSCLFGHLNQFTSREIEWDWTRRLGKTYAFFNCDRLQVRTSDLELINEIFLKRNRLFHARVWHEYRLIIIFQSILFNKGEKWKNSRRIFLPALSAYRLKKNDNSSATMRDVNSGIRRLVGLFKRMSQNEWTSPFEYDLRRVSDQSTLARKGFICLADETSPTGRSIVIRAYDIMQVITLDVIFRIGFNLETINVELGAADPQLQMIKTWMIKMDHPIGDYALAIPLVRLLVVPLFYKHFQAYVKFMHSLVGSRKQSSLVTNTKNQQQENSLPREKEEAEESHQKGPRRIYHVLKDEYLAGRMTKREAASQMFAVLIAGFETTATTSSYILWCLARHADHQAKVSADIALAGIESKYLDMFIKEVMRMYPALPHFVMRTPHEDTQVGGYEIKRGMSVYLGVNAVHYDETIWPNPHHFDPERFAEGKTYPPGAYVPFGLGHRMCAGYHLAMREMKTIVCEILSNFTIKLIEPDEMIIESSNIFLTKSTHDIRVQLVPKQTTTTTTMKGADSVEE